MIGRRRGRRRRDWCWKPRGPRMVLADRRTDRRLLITRIVRELPGFGRPTLLTRHLQMKPWDRDGLVMADGGRGCRGGRLRWMRLGHCHEPPEAEGQGDRD